MKTYPVKCSCGREVPILVHEDRAWQPVIELPPAAPTPTVAAVAARVARKKTVAVPLMSYRCATCGKAFTSYRSLGAHSVSHSKKWRAGRKAAMQKAARTKASRRKAKKKT